MTTLSGTTKGRIFRKVTGKGEQKAKKIEDERTRKKILVKKKAKKRN